MRYSHTVYARALFDVLKQTEDSKRSVVVRNFWRTLVKNGDHFRVDKIFRSLTEFVVKDGGGRVICLETARNVRDLRVKLENFFNKNDLIEETVNPSLVAGLRVTIDGAEELDSSLAGKFRKMFKCITT